MRRFPKFVAVVLAIAIIISSAMCLTTIADASANTYTTVFDEDNGINVTIASEGFLAAFLKLDIEGYDILPGDEEAGEQFAIAVQAQGTEGDVNLQYDAYFDGTALSIILLTSGTDLTEATSATINIPVQENDGEKKHIALTHIQAADAGTFDQEGNSSDDEALLTFNGVSKDGTIQVVNHLVCNHADTATTTVDATCTEAGSITVTCKECDEVTSTEEIPVLDHVDEDPVDDKCDNCGADMEVPCAHNYTYEYTTSGDNYITRKICTGTCGYDEVVSTIAKSTTRTFATILPENDLSLLYRFAKASVDNYTNLELEVKKQVYAKGATESTTETIILTEHSSMTTSNKVDCEEFKFSNIAAYEVLNDVAVRLFGTNANGDRVFIREVASYSVYSYVKGQMNGTTANDDLKNALVDLLEYAGTTQILLNFNTANLANSDTYLLPAWKEAGYGTDKSTYPTKKSDLLVVTASDKYQTEVGSISFGMSLNPQEKVYIIYNLNVTPTNLPAFTGDRNNLYFKISYLTTTGKTEDVLYDASDLKYNDETGKYYFTFGLAPIAMMDYPVTGILYYGNPDEEASYVISTITYSIESYIAGQLESTKATDELKANLKAMYAYSRTNAKVAKIDRYVVQ